MNDSLSKGCFFCTLASAITSIKSRSASAKALGARHSAVVAMILRETGLLLAAGLMADTVLAAAGVQLIASRLYRPAPADPVAIGAAVAMLAGVALLAAWVPAHRASRVDPLIALRYE